MIQHVPDGDVIDLRTSNEATADEAATLLSTDRLEVIRLMMPAGKEIPTYTPPGQMLVQCLQGRVGLRSAHDSSHELEAGQMLLLPPNEPHSFRGIENGSLLLTVLLPVPKDKPGVAPEQHPDAVQEASEESFPASDPPSWTVTRS